MIRLQVMQWFSLENTLNFYLIILLADNMVCLLMIGKLVNIKLSMMNRKVSGVGCPVQDDLNTAATLHKTVGMINCNMPWVREGVSIPVWCDGMCGSWERQELEMG